MTKHEWEKKLKHKYRVSIYTWNSQNYKYRLFCNKKNYEHFLMGRTDYMIAIAFGD